MIAADAAGRFVPGVLLVFALVTVGCSGSDAGGDSSDAADQVARDDKESTVEAEPQVSEPVASSEAGPTTVAPAPTTVPQPAFSLPSFAPPPAYGYPLGTLTCCEQPAAHFRFLLLGAPGEGADPFSAGDLLVTVAPHGRVSLPADFVGELTWHEEDLGVVRLVSRSFTTEELVEIADSFSFDEASLGAEFPIPDGYSVVADQWYEDRIGPLTRYEDDGLVPEGLTYVSTWTTGGTADEETIRVTAKPASAGELELVAYLFNDASRVPVRGGAGVLGNDTESMQLYWIDDQGAMVTIMATDPSVDLVAMAESEPPTPWSQGPGQTVVTGTLDGTEWSLRVVPNAQRGYQVCLELEVTNCAEGAVYTGFLGLPGLFVGGVAPSCAVQVRSGSTTVDTVAGPDGRRYFGSWDIDIFSEADSWGGLPPLEALDAAGATVGTWGSNEPGWRDDRC